jgi:hypothetical protein
MAASSANSSSKNSVHGIIIALAILNAVGLLGMFFKLDMISNNQKMTEQEVSECKRTKDWYAECKVAMMGIQEEAMKPIETETASAWKPFISHDLNFSYPQDWFVALYDDDFVAGQKNIRLTSSQGSLINTGSSGGPGLPGVQYFEEGFHVEMKKLADAQIGFTKKLPTKYKNIVKNGDECEDAGCPNEEYLFTTDSGSYLLTFQYTGEKDYSSYVDKILSSLK